MLKALSPVDLDLSGVSIQTVLDELTKQTSLYFIITGNTIAVSKETPGGQQQAGKSVNPVRKYKGVILDKHGESVIGASIMLKGEDHQ